MRPNLDRRACLVAAVAAVVMSGAALAAGSQRSGRPERFTALAVPPGASGSPVVIDFIIERWSTPAEHDRFMAGLSELGTKGVIAALRKLPRVGSFAATGMAGYPITYAWRVTGQDGIERITLATERYVNFWESYNGTRSLDYPITLVQLTLKPGGNGNGQVAVAAKMDLDAVSKTIVIENLDIQPVILTTVKRLR